MKSQMQSVYLIQKRPISPSSPFLTASLNSWYLAIWSPRVSTKWLHRSPPYIAHFVFRKLADIMGAVLPPGGFMPSVSCVFKRGNKVHDLTPRDAELQNEVLDTIWSRSLIFAPAQSMSGVKTHWPWHLWVILTFSIIHVSAQSNLTTLKKH